MSSESTKQFSPGRLAVFIIVAAVSLIGAGITSYFGDQTIHSFLAATSAVFAFIGAGFGAVGASSLFVTEKAADAVNTSAAQDKQKSGTTETWNTDQRPAQETLRRKANRKDWLTLISWSFVLVGAGLAFAAIWVEGKC